MTTILVTKDLEVVSDGQATAGDLITSLDVKKITNADNVIICGAGRYSHIVKFRDWVIDTLEAEGAKQEYPNLDIGLSEGFVSDDFIGLVVYSDGTVYQFEGCNDVYEITLPAAIGSGAGYALAAHYTGASAVESIEAAIRFDPFTGGEIQVECFEEEEPPLTKEVLKGMTKEQIIEKFFGSGEADTEPEVNIVVEDPPSIKVDSIKEAFETIGEQLPLDLK